MFKRSSLSVSVLLGCLAGACVANPTVAPAGSSDPAADSPSISTEEVAPTPDTVATDLSATETAKLFEATNQAATQTRATSDAVKRVQTREAATADAIARSTASAQGMLDSLIELQEQGYLEETSGTYYALADFDESWAQINWYQWWYTGFAPTDFVVRADAAWDSASDRANWWTSGCGFVFREDGVPNHYLAYLGLDGYVYFSRNVNGRGAQLGRSYYGRVDTPSGGAQLMLVVQGPAITFFVNGERVHSRQDQGLSSGNLALTLLSGINTGFGTRCEMTNIELWELD